MGIEDDISIHALRGEGDSIRESAGAFDNISIHALRGEGDVHPTLRFWKFFKISIHALRGEGDGSAIVIAERGE